ncbi:MAG: tryptophan synthase subunit alpha [Verrucomicrobia bacterium]|nr:tryptophan synthase subunit alpha [Cytophagales bacterium]
MNRITQRFEDKKQGILNLYFTAGFPKIDDTRTILTILQEAGADMIEIGMPFSDPIADGPTIQASNQQALDNGMNLKKLFEQLANFRSEIHLPVILMGYINPVLQFGIENFCKACQQVGIDGLILPDLPMQEYLEIYKPVFEKHGLLNIFLITPQTSENRIREIDENTEGFIYVVSSASTTGAKTAVSEEQMHYFERINTLNLKNPTLIGFGISDHQTFLRACKYANGAIIGSAFIKVLEQTHALKSDILNFVKKVKED